MFFFHKFITHTLYIILVTFQASCVIFAFMSQVKPLQSSLVATRFSFWKFTRFSHHFLFLDNYFPFGNLQGSLIIFYF